MGKAQAFEDIKAWQLARGLVLTVYALTNDARFRKDPALRDQLRRAAVSSMSNIAEGFERGSRREFVRFLYMARGSAGEVRSHLYVARDLAYLDEVEFKRIREQVVEVSKVIFGFIRHLEAAENMGD
ncbi:MAG: four helix bundle protein [Nitrospira sp.]|nr:four helix bundle protein [Nitrospira sp.]